MNEAVAEFPHVPVLRDEVLEAFSGRRLEVFADGTLGAGGHAEALLTHCDIKRYIGIDRDPEALRIAGERLAKFGDRVTLVRGEFAQLPQVLRSVLGRSDGVLDGLLLDLGVSSMQLDEGNRGFSFSRDGPVDMRMDPSAPLTAAEIVNTWSEADIAHIIRTYGEDPHHRRLARSIVYNRELTGPITTTAKLADVLAAAIPAKLRHRRKPTPGGPARGSYTHPATRAFQALRIATNGELQQLEEALRVVPGVLRPGGGRVAVISFHSLEDRMVKTAVRAWEKERGGVWQVTRKVVMPGEEECGVNPRARSSRMRVAERLEEDEVFERKKNKYARERDEEDDD